MIIRNECFCAMDRRIAGYNSQKIAEKPPRPRLSLGPRELYDRFRQVTV
jgi:hypothetical protein